MFGNSTQDLEARVVNNALIVSFMKADPPRVWRADMSGLSTATLEVREGQPGMFRLVMRTGGGKEEDVSTFRDRETATNALRVVTGAMLRGDSGGPAVSYSAPASSSSTAWTVAKVAIGIVILYVLLKVVGGILMGGIHGGVVKELPAGVKPGAAVPADKIFGGR